MTTMSVRDSMFLFAESRTQPIHFGSLLLFDRPAGVSADFLGDLHRRFVADDDVAPIFRRRAEPSFTSASGWRWVDDDQIDMEYHVRLSALPRPGRIRELLELVSRLHGTLLDRQRPLWEFHLIEGVEGDRFALYSKIHHAMMDGVTAARHMQRTMNPDPDASGGGAFWKVEPKPRDASESDDDDGGLRAAVASAASQGWKAVRSTARTAARSLNVGPALASTTYQGLTSPDVVLPFEAPPSMLNVPITGARRFAAQSWPLKRIHRVKERTDATVNDVVLAMCAGSLRRYLAEHEGLPLTSLVAALPVALGGGDTGEGNRLGAILATLATDEADPAARLERIKRSTRAAKDNLSQRDPVSVAALSAAIAAPMGLAAISGLSGVTTPAFNLIISNVPGPKETLYWEGARLEGIYPLSVVLDGQALNITVTTYAEDMEFGLTGDRRSVPHLQRLLTHLEDALVELEEVADGSASR